MTVVSSTAELASVTRVRRFGRRPAPGLTGVSLAVGVLFAMPLGYLLAHNQGFVSSLRDAEAGGALSRSLMLATACALTTAVVGTGMAWLVARTDLPGRSVVRILAPLPLVFPSFVGAFCFLAAFADGGLLEEYLLSPLGIDARWRIEGFGWSVVVLTMFTYPYVYLPVIARLAALPASLEESARSLGCSARQTFFRVVLPQSAGAVGAGAMLVFLYSLSEFGAVSLLRYTTLTRSIYLATQAADRASAYALSLVLACCALIVIAIERTWSRRRVRTEAVGSGRMSIQYSLGRWRWLAVGPVVTVVVLALVGPVAVLVHWAIRGVQNGSQLHAERLLPAMVNTARFGLVGALVAAAVVLPVAYLSVRHPGNVIGRAVNAVVTSAFALPGLVLGFVFVNLAQSDWVPEWLYQSVPLLIVAYVVHFGAQALRASEVAVAGVPRRLGDAARSLGARNIRRFLRVDLPLMRSGLAAGAGLVLLSITKELPATLLLIPTETDTLALRVWSATDGSFYAQAGFFALWLVALSGVLTWLITMRPLAREGQL
jgi:iron(III) transport system permease protein